MGNLENGQVKSIYTSEDEESYIGKWIERVKCYVLVAGKSETCLVFKSFEEKEMGKVKIEVIVGGIESGIKYENLNYDKL